MEVWDVLDKEGNPKGRTILRGQPLQPGDYHLAIHAWIIDSNNSFLIQKRADNVKLFPGIWATTGGSALTGEDSEGAMIRELEEELGIKVSKGEMTAIARILRKDSILDLWLLRRDFDLNQLRLQAEEVSAAKFVSVQQFLTMIQTGEFYDYGQEYFEILFRRAGIQL